MAFPDLNPLPSTSDPVNFAAYMDALLGKLPAWAAEAERKAAGMTAAASGGAMAASYTFSTTTAAADPGAGTLRLDNAVQNTATAIYLDTTDASGADWTSAIDLFDDSTSAVKGYLALRKADDGTKYLVFALASMAQPAGYRTASVTCLASSAASPFADGDSLVIEFTRTGDKGDTGAAGAVWRDGAGVPDNGVGANGDYYLRTNGDVYQRSAGTYSVVANIKGAAGATGALILLATASASSSAAVDFTSGIDSTYDEYEIHFHAVLPETTNQKLWLRASKDSGGSFLTTAIYSYSQEYIDGTNAFQIGYSSGSTTLQLTPEDVPNAGTISGAGISGVIRFFRPSQGGYVNFMADLCYRKDSDTLTRPVLVGQAAVGAGSLNAIRLLFSAGNILSGEFKLYGIQKA